MSGIASNTRHLFRFRESDPGQFAERMVPVGVDVTAAEPGAGGRFGAEVVAARLPRIGAFRIRIDSKRVRTMSRTACLTVPLDGPLEIIDEHGTEMYSPGWAHLADADRPFEARPSRPDSVLVVVIEPGLLRSHVGRSGHRENPLRDGRMRRIDLRAPHGESLMGYLDFFWTELRRGGSFLESATATHEIEDLLLALLLLAAGPSQLRAGTGHGVIPRAFLKRAEEYLRENLRAPISMTDLAEVVGRSPSTLIRAFRLHHGMTPMRFRKQLRLESARRDLLGADPAETSVTEVAMRYGFYALGRFSGDYLRTFGELPSETLKDF